MMKQQLWGEQWRSNLAFVDEVEWPKDMGTIPPRLLTPCVDASRTDVPDRNGFRLGRHPSEGDDKAKLSYIEMVGGSDTPL